MTTAALKIGTRHWKTVAKNYEAENKRLREIVWRYCDPMAMPEADAKVVENCNPDLTEQSSP